MFIFWTKFSLHKHASKDVKPLQFSVVQLDTEVESVATEVVEFCPRRTNFLDNNVCFMHFCILIKNV